MDKRVLLVAHDIAPSNAFLLLRTALTNVGADVKGVILNTGKNEPPSRETLDQWVEESDVVLIGLSSPAKNAAAEILAATQATSHGTTYGFYADTFGAWQRAWFAPFREHASVLFVLNEKERERAQTLFPTATIVASGNPMWEEYFRPAYAAEARAKAGARESDFVIVAPGTKNPVVNMKLWLDTIDAAYPFTETERQPLVLLAKHPGDKTSQDVYAPLLEFGNKSGMRVVMPEIRTDELVPGCDVVVHGGTASVAIHAACRRIPIIDLTQGFLMQEWLKRELGLLHTEINVAEASWEAASTVALGYHLACVHSALMGAKADVAAVERLRTSQQRMIPSLTPGAAIARMVEAIGKL